MDVMAPPCSCGGRVLVVFWNWANMQPYGSSSFSTRLLEAEIVVEGGLITWIGKQIYFEIPFHE